MARQTSAAIDQQLLKVLAHPLRVRILAVLSERVTSPAQMAEEFNENLSRVSYHVNVLLKYECIELVGTRPRRGATEHFYRGTGRAALIMAETLSRIGIPATVAVVGFEPQAGKS
ncbi:MAG TPA: helix-turn-helix domain-containing protein [Solirubrobacterales bacterium]